MTWERNDVQFPRLLAEIYAAGLTAEQEKSLCASMDLTRSQIYDLLERADTEWERLKDLRHTMVEQKETGFLPFTLVAEEAKGGGSVHGSIDVGPGGLFIQMQDYANLENNTIFGLHFLDGKLQGVAFANRNSEEPTHTIDFEGAKQ